MNLEEIKSRLMKMKALANAGVGGERANAEKLLAELAAKYGIDLGDLDGEEVVEYTFKFSSTWQRQLFSQLVGLLRQEKAKRGEVLREKELKIYAWTFKRVRDNERLTYAKKSDWLELTAKFEVLKADYKRQQANFYLAFLMANDLLMDPDYDAPKPTREQLKAYKDASFMSLGIKRSSLDKQLENKEA